jgi:hypothetical protein
MGTVFRNYCEKVLASLRAQSDIASIINHGPSIGTIREQAVHDLLSDHLPSAVRITRGQIFDSADAVSKQQDVIMTLKNVPRLPFASGIDMVYAEGVVSTIEVKSDLSATLIPSIGENLSSVRKLVPTISGTSAMMVTHNWPLTRILCGIAAYKGSSFDALLRVLATLPEDHRPDFVLDLSKGILVRNHGFLISPKQGDDDYLRIDDPASGLMFFLTILTEITGTLTSRGVNWRSYLPRD